jgi:hypothetical protein
MSLVDRIVDELVISRCRHVEYEIEHHVSRAGIATIRGRCVRPTQDEFGITALVMWGMMQLAAEVEKSGGWDQWHAPSE